MKRPLGLLLRRLRCRMPSLAIVTEDGVLLTSWSRDLAESGLLPQAIENGLRYFPLSPRDLVLIQDPFVGGPGRDGLALVSCWRGANGASLRLATTVHAPALRALRLPPAPLRLGGETNSGVLEALGPAREAVLQAERELNAVMDVLERPAVQALLSKKNLADALGSERQVVDSIFNEMPDGDALTEMKLPTGETLRLKMHGESQVLSFDFSGTSPSKTLQLPLSATTGIVWSAVRERLGLDVALDSFSARHMPVIAPQGCFLNARGGSCDRALDDVTPWLIWAVESLVQKWDRRKVRGLVNPFDVKAVLEFSGGRRLELKLPSGSAAREDAEGVTFWRPREGCPSFSLERLERDWPVRFVRIDERVSAAGKCRVPGGRGLHLQLELREAAKLSWGPHGPDGRVKCEKNQAPFDLPDVVVKREGAADASIPAGGAASELRAKDIVVLLSGSGGGLV